MLKAISLTPPTLAQHRAASNRWLATVGPCFYENWPKELRELSFITSVVELTRDDQSVLLDSFDNLESDNAPALFEKLRTAAIPFQDGFFPRLSSRSAKDACVPTLRCRSPEEIVVQFSTSERILDDLIEYKYADVPCHLLLREWCDIPREEEWRCFLREGRIIGMTQYHYGEVFNYEDAPSMHSRIQRFLQDQVIPFLHMETVVVDVWLKDEPMLIEINPYGLSDPCLFTYVELAQGQHPLRVADIT